MYDKLNQAVLIEYAIKGVNSDIEKHERSISRGVQLLEDKAAGVSYPTAKTTDEIRQVIFEKKKEIEYLKGLENDMKLQLLEIKDEL